MCASAYLPRRCGAAMRHIADHCDPSRATCTSSTQAADQPPCLPSIAVRLQAVLVAEIMIRPFILM